MSQKSSLPQTAKSVSQVLMSDSLHSSRALFSWWSASSGAALRWASTPAPAFRNGAGTECNPSFRQSLASTVSANPAVSALPIRKADLDTFEKLHGDIQTAYGREDVEQIGALTTPEILSHFSEEISNTAKQGLRNEVSDVKLLQGDLSEARREGARSTPPWRCGFLLTREEEFQTWMTGPADEAFALAKEDAHDQMRIVQEVLIGRSAVDVVAAARRLYRRSGKVTYSLGSHFPFWPVPHYLE
jgi:Tim44-like domain